VEAREQTENHLLEEEASVARCSSPSEEEDDERLMASVDISRGGQPCEFAAGAPAAGRLQQQKRPLGLTSDGDVCARPVAGVPGAAVVAGGE
jgi:hypothetical protein